MSSPVAHESLTGVASETVPLKPPPLENGDRLTRDEFERRYAAMPQVKKAELIEGVVHMPSPVRLEQHGRPQAHLIGWLFQYVARTPHVDLGDNTTVRLDLDNEPQPDALLFIEPAHGGNMQINTNGYIEGAPELVAEVAASSVSIDLHDKFRAYRRNEVREYVVWRVQDQVIDWFVLRDGDYTLIEPTPDGVVKSDIFPGLWLDVAALLRGDLAKVLEVLQQGLQDPAHAAFVGRLQDASKS
jgi:Uma2 family endonuclease